MRGSPRNPLVQIIAPWIDSIRQTILGGLILGFGFLWSDFACYAVGVALGVMIEVGLSAMNETQN
jgi:Protein of unknown function (DUF2809)